MFLSEFFLGEAIEQTLSVDAFDAFKHAFIEFVENAHPEISRFMGLQKLEREYNEIGDDPEFTSRAKLRDAIFNQWQDKKLRDLPEDNPFRAELCEELKHVLELTLQDVARDYFESKFNSNDHNLYWLEHIIVNLDYKGQDDFDSTLPPQAGGYFDRYGRKEFFNTRYAQAEVDHEEEYAQGIKIYIHKSPLWNIFIDAYSEFFHELYFGESPEYLSSIEASAEEVIPIFVHEVVHMEQDTRIRLNTGSRGFPNSAEVGFTMLPNKEKRPRGRKFRRGETGTIHYDGPDKRLGKRGGSDHLWPSPKVTDKDYRLRWADYLGTQEEIEAHAAGYAARLILEWLRDYKRRSYFEGPEVRQEEMNRIIDNLVRNLKEGNLPEDNSLQLYKRFIRSRAGTDRMYQKVWNRFLNRVVKHLLSHKKKLD